MTGSMAVHALLAGLAVLLPLLLTDPLPAPGQPSFRVFYYDPPPPPPPPLPRGSGLGSLLPERPPAPAQPRAPLAVPVTETAAPTPADGGDPEGSAVGVPEGMEGGVEGGVVGGVPGGVVGGILGGTGNDPVGVAIPDQPAKPLRTPGPQYPHEAFVKKIEGTVLIEILIDERGRVARARVLASVPPLDEAALAAVRSWAFVPARHQGRPVASLARAPVSFRIY
jgi:protein TonB